MIHNYSSVKGLATRGITSGEHPKSDVIFMIKFHERARSFVSKTQHPPKARCFHRKLSGTGKPHIFALAANLDGWLVTHMRDFISRRGSKFDSRADREPQSWASWEGVLCLGPR